MGFIYNFNMKKLLTGLALIIALTAGFNIIRTKNNTLQHKSDLDSKISSYSGQLMNPTLQNPQNGSYQIPIIPYKNGNEIVYFWRLGVHNDWQTTRVMLPDVEGELISATLQNFNKGYQTPVLSYKNDDGIFYMWKVGLKNDWQKTQIGYLDVK